MTRRSDFSRLWGHRVPGRETKGAKISKRDEDKLGCRRNSRVARVAGALSGSGAQ